MTTVQIWANDDRNEFAVLIKGDHIMQYTTAIEILYSQIVDSFECDTQKESPKQVLNAWIKEHRGDCAKV